MDSALHVLSGCQCPAPSNMATECHNITIRMILKVVSKSSYGSNLFQMDVLPLLPSRQRRSSSAS
eukprot:1137523-Pelagomonas_calceolata.AAC.2